MCLERSWDSPGSRFLGKNMLLLYMVNQPRVHRGQAMGSSLARPRLYLFPPNSKTLLVCFVRAADALPNWQRVHPTLHFIQTKFQIHHENTSTSSAKCKNQSWSTKGGYGPPGPPGPPWSTLVHIFGKISQSVDQNGSEWTRWTTGSTTPLGGPGALRTTLDLAPTFPCYRVE